MKKTLSGLLAAAVILVSAFSVFLANPFKAAATAADDYVVIGTGVNRLWGPYDGGSMSGDVMVFNPSTVAWATANFKAQLDGKDINAVTYKYAEITLKASGTDLAGYRMGIGQDSAGAAVSKAFSNWKLADGTTGITLTTDYQTFKIDLAANGITKFGTTGIADISFNHDTGGLVNISVSSFKLLGGTYMADNEVAADDYKLIDTGVNKLWGPYDGGSMSGDVMVFNPSTVAWATANFKAQIDGKDINYVTYKYAEITLKASGTDLAGYRMGIGQDSAGAAVSKGFSSWVQANGTVGINVTTDYQTFTIDLYKNGITKFGTTGIADISFNHDTGGLTTISVSKLVLKGGTYIQENTGDNDNDDNDGGTPPPAVQKDNYVVGDAWNDVPNGTSTENHWGPYGGFFKNDTANGNLLFYGDSPAAWMTLNFLFETFDHDNGYKYFVIVAKTDLPDSTDLQMCIGQDASGVKHGMAFGDWTLADGTKGAALTTKFQTFCFDLSKSGTTQFFKDPSIPDFALNGGPNTKDCTVTIDKIYLTNTVPTDAVTNATKTTSNVKTGDPGLGAAVLLLPLIAGLAAAAGIRAKKRR